MPSYSRSSKLGFLEGFKPSDIPSSSNSTGVSLVDDSWLGKVNDFWYDFTHPFNGYDGYDYSNEAAQNINALGAGDRDDNSAAAVSNAISAIAGQSGNNGSSGGSTGAGAVAPATDSPFIVDDDGQIGFADDDWQKAWDMIQQVNQQNNEWSANQALLQREWQERMSNTAHQREIADLKKAGLNPVLSAGGSGASTPSGAMGQTDTSNTKIVADMAMGSLAQIGNSAAGAMIASGYGSSSNGLFGKITDAYINNPLARQLINTGLSIIRGGIVGGITASLFPYKKR